MFHSEMQKCSILQALDPIKCQAIKNYYYILPFFSAELLKVRQIANAIVKLGISSLHQTFSCEAISAVL